MGVMEKQPKMFQKKGNGWSPSVTLACYPLNGYGDSGYFSSGTGIGHGL